MPIATDNHSQGAMGGTELIKKRMVDNIEPEILDSVQIFFSRVEDKIREDMPTIFYAHDLAEDPCAQAALGDGQWKRFTHFVFVSHWQKERYVEKYGIPYSKISVIENFVPSFLNPRKFSMPPNDLVKPEDGVVDIIYTSTPQRGLNILYAAFNHLSQTDKKIRLSVFSSFKLYNREDHDKSYEPLFNLLREHPQITYHGAVPNEVVREHLTKSHIWALPSIWPETSCLALIEAMSAGCLCIHSDLAALPETSRGLTVMYPFHENVNVHATRFSSMLKTGIEVIRDGNYNTSMAHLSSNFIYDMRHGVAKWTHLITKLKDEFKP